MKTIIALVLLALVGCGSSSDDSGPVSVVCPPTLPTTCSDEVFTSTGQPIAVKLCGDLTLVSESTGTCCFQGEPADFVPNGTECH